MTTLQVLRGRPLFALCLFASVLLSGCGGSSGGGATDNGGGGPSSPKPAAVKNVTLTPKATKILQFSWDDVTDETEYRLLENPDGSSGFEPVATIPADSVSYDHVVSLPARINAQYILQSCNAEGCSDSATVSVTTSLVSAIGYVKASNPDAWDRFGGALSLSADGKTLAVGAINEASNATGIGGNESNDSASEAGAVYVFRQDAGNLWTQQAYIKASNTGSEDFFGNSVSLSADGNTLAVGAYGEDSNATGINGDQSGNSASESGAVYIFTRSGPNWSQQAYIKASNTEAGDHFGSAVSLSADGNTLAVGAIGEDNSGAVYLFARSDSDWAQQDYIKASNAEAGDRFGGALSLSADGNTLAVAAYYEASGAAGINGVQSDNTVASSGAVYLFTRSGTDWIQQAYIKASNTDANDQFGSAVSLSGDGNTLAVSAAFESSSATGINGDQSDNSANSSGAVYLFARSDSDWAQQAYIKASNAEAHDRFGEALSLSADGNTLAVAAYYEASRAAGINGVQSDNTVASSGAVYLFTRSGSDWIQQAYIKASNTDSGDTLGSNLSLSEDGNTLAVGAYSENSNASGINGDQAENSLTNSGAVYLY